jgi:hypothetical protein
MYALTKAPKPIKPKELSYTPIGFGNAQIFKKEKTQDEPSIVFLGSDYYPNIGEAICLCCGGYFNAREVIKSIMLASNPSKDNLLIVRRNKIGF